MTGVQAVALVAVAITGSCVALIENPLRETFLLGIYGLTLSALFFTLQAPDVALSAIVVGAIGLPLIILAALRKVREQEHAHEEKEKDGGE